MTPFLVLTLAAILSLMMAVAWLVQRQTRNSGWIDVIWSAATGLSGAVGALWPSLHVDHGRQVLVAMLILLWAARLAGHIALRAAKGGDDPRYADMAQKAGARWPLELFVFLQIQAAAALVLVLSVRMAAIHPGPFPGIGDMAGVTLLVIAVVGEGLADAQLARFSAKHKGQVCDTGLWRYSRHPNYFFEWLGWCAFAVIAIAPDAPFWNWVALSAPVLMYGLLVYVSGIPPLEAHMLRTRGDAFRAYQARTSAFFPLPVRRRLGGET
ncbi:MAG: DUF1295 domain-containing protein [Asticcacaulis sp.]|uniref:DUF1295 domain-containing protein n=1 Tax=Asticcacaulis sp. TaxID=1872648 RepID=UPI0039E3C89F